MKRTPTKLDLAGVPAPIAELIGGAAVFDSSCSPEARVYYIEREGGMFLKASAAGSLEREARMDCYFHSLGIGAEVLGYESGERDWLLTRALRGEDCTHFTDDPRRLAERIAEELRTLHQRSTEGCPVAHRTRDYLATVEEGYALSRVDLSYAEDYGITDVDGAIRTVREGACLLKSDTLIHGDYCLPNIILNKDLSLSGFIDLGAGGVADRHIDLFWGAWTLRFNLGTDRYREFFFDAYGRDKINEDTLRVIAAAEVFG